MFSFKAIASSIAKPIINLADTLRGVEANLENAIITPIGKTVQRTAQKGKVLRLQAKERKVKEKLTKLEAKKAELEKSILYTDSDVEY